MDGFYFDIGLDPNFPSANPLRGSYSFLILNSDSTLMPDFCVFLSFVVPTTGEDDEISSFQFEHNTID